MPGRSKVDAGIIGIVDGSTSGIDAGIVDGTMAIIVGGRTAGIVDGTIAIIVGGRTAGIVGISSTGSGAVVPHLQFL